MINFLRKQLLPLVIATLLLHLILIQPNHPAAMTVEALWLFPLELPALLIALLLLDSKKVSTQIFRLLIVFLLIIIALAKMADYSTFVSYQRAFNLLVDQHLIHAAWNLGVGSFGSILMTSFVALGFMLVFGVARLLWWATEKWAALTPPLPIRWVAMGMLLPALVLPVLEIGQALRTWSLPFQPPGAAFTARVGIERVMLYRETVQDLRIFTASAQEDRYATRAAEEIFSHLRGQDVVLIYVESYGRSSFLNPLYSETHTGTLREFESALSAKGLAMHSAFLTAPMVGGQSWLSHATMASGLWIDHQGRYRALLASPRKTLFHHLRRAGWQTAAVMPAITMDWPEGDYFGFDTILAARHLGYEGEPYNWVTMPDQFTLKAMDRMLRTGQPGIDRAPLFAQVALISSHAPWLPVPPVIDWDRIGDGTIFNTWANDGDPPEVVWRDPNRVREKFRRAVDYSLRVVGSYALRHAEDPPLLIILGDHEPAPFVSQVEGFDVPIHIIGTPAQLQHIASWGWKPGLVPAAEAPVWRMDQFRDQLLNAFSSIPE